MRRHAIVWYHPNFVKNQDTGNAPRTQIAILDDDHVIRMVRYALAGPAEITEEWVRNFFLPEDMVYRTRFFGHKFELSGLLHAGLLPDGAGLARTA